PGCHDRYIIFLHAARLECLLELGSRLRGASEEQAAAGVGVEPVHGRWRPPKSAAQFIQPGGNRITPAAGPVDRQPRWFVDDDRLRVDEQDAVGEKHCQSLRGAQRRSNPAARFWIASPDWIRGRNDEAAVDAFVTPLPQAKESSELGNINLFPSDLKWLMDASRPLRAGNAFGREWGTS